MTQLTLEDAGWYMAARGMAWKWVEKAVALLGWGITSYRAPGRVRVMRSVRELKRRRDTKITLLEAMQLVSLVRATAKLGGCMAEVGVYQGGSARLIREADTSRSLHLFDTFEGLPELVATDTAVRSGRLRKGRCTFPLEEVKNYFRGCNGVHFHKGLFPHTGEAVKEEKFSFVHADVDLYSSTRGVLEFFYPRLLRGGIIVSHDFATLRGVREAIEEFFKDLPEPVIELPGDQAMVVKL
jgi:hypothetical protein